MLRWTAAAACFAWMSVCYPRDARHVRSAAGATAGRPVRVSVVQHGAAAAVRVLFYKSVAACGTGRMVFVVVVSVREVEKM